MQDFIINKELNLIKRYNPDYTEEKMEILEYGLTGLYILISKSVIIFSISYILGIFVELLIFMLIYNAIRLFSFGMHATSSTKCLVASAISFLSATYICKITILPVWFKIVFGVLGILYIIKYSPADTEKRPIVNPKRRMTYKILSSVIAITMVICSLTIQNDFVANACTLSLLIQCVMISPITYKLTNQQYDNYKNYHA